MEIFPPRARARANRRRDNYIVNRFESRGETIDNYFECVWVSNTCERDEKEDNCQKARIISSVSRRWTRKLYPNNVNYLCRRTDTYRYVFVSFGQSIILDFSWSRSFQPAIHNHAVTCDMENKKNICVCIFRWICKRSFLEQLDYYSSDRSTCSFCNILTSRTINHACEFIFF